MTTTTTLGRPPAAPASAGYSRVTVIGSLRRMDIVLPSGEPVGRLLPDLLELLQEPVGRPPQLRHLVNGVGEALSAEATLAGSGVLDGAVLRLVGVDDSPPAPIVYDVTEETAGDLHTRAWLWNEHVRRWATTLLAMALAAAAGPLAQAWLPGLPGMIELVLAALLCGMTGIALVYWREPLGTAVLLCGAVSAAEAVWALGSLAGWPVAQRWTLLLVVVCAMAALLGAVTPLGRGGLIGGGVGFGLVLFWWGATVTGLPPVRVAAMLAVITIVLLGLLPRLTLVAAGLTRLDDTRADGHDVTRRDVNIALATVHRGLTLAVVAVAVSAALAGWLLAEDATRWSLLLACLLGLIVISRTRGYPLIGEVLAAWLAAGVIGLALLNVWSRHSPTPVAPLSIVAGGLIVTLACIAWRPVEHVRARLRRIVDRVETVLIIATVPTVIGVFGTYGRLLHAF